jgi:uncharacterized protein YjgD (DUF1641 family)
MFSELELEYKMALDLVDSEISRLNNLPAEVYQCQDLLKNQLVIGDTELTERITARMNSIMNILTSLDAIKVY